MSEKAALLADTLQKQDEILSELRSVVLRQRDALKEGRVAELQQLMSELRHVSVRCQAIETKRQRVTDDLAKEMGTAAVVSEIVRALPEADAAVLDESADRLMRTVSSLKAEMSILSRLMDEAKMLNQMLITEWQKLGQKFMGGGMLGAFDARI